MSAAAASSAPTPAQMAAEAAPVSKSSAELIEEVEGQIKAQGNKVRGLKAEKAPAEQIKAEVAILQTLKLRLQEMTDAQKAAEGPGFDRAALEDLLKRRFFFAPAFELYGGTAGLFDLGPCGCAIKANILEAWRQHFVMNEGMLEVECTALTPYDVLLASGHVERFSDVMVKDMKTGECLRADHLLEDVMEAKIKDAKSTEAERAEYRKIHAQADNYSKAELHELFTRFKVKHPVTGNDLSEPVDFNMMFSTSIGPTGALRGFLRPETAQGIFLCFKRLYEFNNGRLPFAGAQIGNSFRNEISPRAGLLRVREFAMAEIEHFVDPDDKSHPRFSTVADLEVPLLTACDQMEGKGTPKLIALGKALEDGVLTNETHAYFLGRIYLFVKSIGADPERMRFRQHMSNEMAHYAKDCWDLELHTSYGWIECVGCADRSCYDLECHAKATQTVLQASVPLKEPQEIEVVEVLPDKGKVGKGFKRDAAIVFKHFAELDNAGAQALGDALEAEGKTTLTIDGKDFVVTKDMVKVEKKTKRIHDRKFTPGVIEPSFGIGRIIYCILEHVYHVRENDAQRGYLSLPPAVAPVKCSVLPLSNNAEFAEPTKKLADILTKARISFRVDDSSAAIGRRYARTDEIAIPFGLTIDFDTSKDQTVTLRERDSMQQVRLQMEEVPATIDALCTQTMTWEEVAAKYGLVDTSATDEDSK